MNSSVLSKIRYFFSAIGMLVIFLQSTQATEMENDGKPVLDIPRVEQAPAFKNFVGMKPGGEVEKKMKKVEGFIQQRPKDGEPATQKTDVYLCHDDKNLYVVFVAFDSEPEKIRGRLSRRERVFNDDQVEIMLDTFHDERRAFAFIANPLGVQWDALWTEGSGFDDSWDTLWYSKGELTDKGYVVWMKIPFKSLRFPTTPEQDWGIVLLREVQRGSAEQSFWPRVSSRLEGRLNQAATMKIRHNISPGRNIQLIPYTTSRSFRILNQQHPQGPRFTTDSVDPSAGLDAKFVVNDNMALDATANPDFSQVESDEPQITVNQRFEVFFPEKRPFFLENSNFFNTPINLVFTRRIGDPQFGARFTGKTGPYAIGAMLIDDESPGKSVPNGDPLHGKRAFFGIARVSRDIFKQSNLGFTFTDREFEDSHNRVIGVDSRIKIDQNWVGSVQGVLSSTKDLAQNEFTGHASNLALNRNGRQFANHSHFRSFDVDFRADAGFIPRTDMVDVHQFMSYFFRPERKFLIRWGPEFLVQRIWDISGTRLDESIEGSLEWEFTGQTQFEVNYRKSNELLRPQDVSGLSANRDFSTDAWEIEYETSIMKEVTLEGDFGWGKAINFVPSVGQEPQLADMVNSEIELVFRPVNQLQIDNTYIYFNLNDREVNRKIFTNHILRSKWNWQFNRKLSLRLIFQYNATLANNAVTSLQTSKNINFDFLFTYLVNPWTALYAGVNSNYQNLDLINANDHSEIRRTRNHFLNDGRQFFVKYSYLFRF